MESIHLRNQVTNQEKRVADLQAANAQLQKVMAQMRTCEDEIDYELSSMRAKLAAIELQVSTLESYLEKERK